MLTSRQRNEVGHNMFVILVDAVTSSHVVFVVSLATVSLEDSLKSLEVAQTHRGTARNGLLHGKSLRFVNYLLLCIC